MTAPRRRAHWKGRERFEYLMANIEGAMLEEISAALAQAGEEVAEAVRRAVPVRSGKLRRSIRSYTGIDDPGRMNANVRGVDSGGNMSATARRMSKAGLLVTVAAGDADAWYARLVEFGVKGTAGKPRGPNKGAGARGPIPAQPYFFPTVRAQKRAATRRVAAAVGRAVKRVRAKAPAAT